MAALYFVPGYGYVIETGNTEVFVPGYGYVIETQGGAGDQTLSPPLLVNSNTFFAHTVAPGDVSLSPPLLVNSNTFFAHTVAPGDVNLSPPLLVNDNTFYTHTVTVDGGDQTLSPPLLVNDNTFFAHTVTPGDVNLSPPLLVNSNTFFAHTVTQPGAMTLTQADIDAIADAVWTRGIEGVLTPEMMLRVILAALAGKCDGVGTSTEHYYAQDGIKTRITATFDESNNRTSIITDGTP